MALNIKPFEGPRAPDLTDPAQAREEVALAASSKKEESKNSDAYLLMEKSRSEKLKKQGKLKKLDIL